MIWTDLYLYLGWHIVLCLALIVWGLFKIDDIGIIIIAVAVIYFLFAPYAHEEKIRNCQTENGNTVSIVVKFKEPIVKLIFKVPRDVKVISINGKKLELKLEKSSKKVYDQFRVYELKNQTVFEGNFYDENGKWNNLLLIL